MSRERELLERLMKAYGDLLVDPSDRESPPIRATVLGGKVSAFLATPEEPDARLVAAEQMAEALRNVQPMLESLDGHRAAVFSNIVATALEVWEKANA